VLLNRLVILEIEVVGGRWGFIWFVFF